MDTGFGRNENRLRCGRGNLHGMCGARIHRIGKIGLLVLLLGAAAGAPACSKRVTAPAAVQPPEPALDSPRNALLALKWVMENRNLATARTLFTDDYVFVFAETDSAGIAFRDTPWTREDELLYLEHLFHGGGTEPPADRIRLEVTNTLNVFGSTYPGHDPGWHKTMRAEAYLRITRGESTLEIRGPSLFYFVRGDSAAIPQDLIDEGLGPDSTRWWIERWEDETVSSGAAMAARAPRAATMPPYSISWGAIKAMYR